MHIHRGSSSHGFFEAGCDILLMPEDLEAAYDAILETVQNGTISEQRLDNSVNKILYYKQQFCGN